MRLGYDFVANHIDHGSCSKRHGPRKQQLRQAHTVSASEPGHRLDQPCQARHRERVTVGIAHRHERQRDGQALRRILQSDAGREYDALFHIAAGKSHPDRQPLGKIVDRDGEHEQPDASPLASSGSLTALKEMLMRDNLIQHGDEAATQ